MSKALVGIFVNTRDAAVAVDQLTARGISEQRISVLAAEPTARESLAFEKKTKGAEGAAIGGGIGAVATGILAGLTTVGALATGGIGLLVAGPLVAVLAGAGAGAIAGGALGGLIGLGFSEYEVKQFEDALEKGSVLVAVDIEDANDKDMVKDILNQNHAKEVSTT